MTEPLRLMALTGRAGAGKDSVAATLVRRLNYRSIAFADALRAEVAEAWRIDARMLQDPGTKEWDIPALALGMCSDTVFAAWRAKVFDDDLCAPRSPRWVMQRWGDWRRLGNPDYFASKVGRWLGQQIGTGWRRLVVTDVRFRNERACVMDAYGCQMRLVRVHRPCNEGRTLEQYHASETGMNGVHADYDLINAGDLAALEHATLAMEAALYGQ
jgi:hypothetical protein